MKNIFLCLFLVVFVNISSAQQQATETKVKFMDADQHALVIRFSEPEKIVAEAVAERLKKAGLKSKNEKGFDAYKGVLFKDIHSSSIDFYVKVEKADKNTSNVILLLSKGYNNFVSSKDEPAMISNAKTFMASLERDIKIVSLQQSLAAQEKVVKESIDKLESQNKSLEKLVKNKAEIEKNITDTQDAIVKQKSDIEAQKQLFDKISKELSAVK